MTTYARVTCEVRVAGTMIERRVWDAVDVMASGRTRAWATRRFNFYRARRVRDQIVLVTWQMEYDPELGIGTIAGSLSGCNGAESRRGIFED